MVKKKRDAAGGVVHIYFPEKEYKKIVEACGNSTCQSVAEYVRTLLFKRSVTIRVRKESMERFLETAIDLKNELRSLIEAGEDVSGLAEEIRQLMLKIYKECLR